VTALPQAAWDYARVADTLATPPRVTTPIRSLNPDLWAIHAKAPGTLTPDDWRVLERAEAAGLPDTQSKDVA
jgi:hypothetical protein